MRIGLGAEAVGANVGFLSQSAEAIENKRVEILMGAKKRNRVRKNMKIKGIDPGRWY